MTVIYADERLLTRLLTHYPTLRDDERILLIEERQLRMLADAMTTILTDRNIELPTGRSTART